MSSDEARAEAEWRFPVTAYECQEDQATEVERFVAGAEWQAERDAERVAKLETEVERLNDALDAADVRYQMLGDWGERMKADAERVAELEAEVEGIKRRDAEVGEDEGWWVGGAWGDYGEAVVPLRILSYVIDGKLDEKVTSIDPGFALTYAEQTARAEGAESRVAELEAEAANPYREETR